MMYLTQAFYHLLTVSLLQHRQQNIQQHPTFSLPLGLCHAEVQYLFLIQINVCFIYYIVIVYGNLSFSAPQPCVDGQMYGDSCDPKIYYQCASGVAYQFQCAAGTVWDERIKNCNWDYLVLTSPTPCGCGRKYIKRIMILETRRYIGHLQKFGWNNVLVRQRIFTKKNSVHFM